MPDIYKIGIADLSCFQKASDHLGRALLLIDKTFVDDTDYAKYLNYSTGIVHMVSDRLFLAFVTILCIILEPLA
jgi:hypothetical protein